MEALDTLDRVRNVQAAQEDEEEQLLGSQSGHDTA